MGTGRTILTIIQIKEILRITIIRETILSRSMQRGQILETGLLQTETRLIQLTEGEGGGLQMECLKGDLQDLKGREETMVVFQITRMVKTCHLGSKKGILDLPVTGSWMLHL